MELFPLESYRGSRICVAFSGGADSVCLLHYLNRHKEAFQITLSAIHVEHGIRGEESLRDLAFCRAFCSDRGIPLEVVQEDVPALAKERGIGIEEAGRSVRYDAFFSVIRGGRADFVATAHHSGDVAETVLFRLARGTSLSGMRTVTERQGIIRPLLGVTRQQIETYISENDLPHVDDATNADESYTRNYIRHTVMPVFEQISKNAQEHLVRFAALAAQDDEYLYSLARKEIFFRHGDAYVPADLPMPLFTRACLICMTAQKDYTGSNFLEISKLKELQSGKKICLPGGQEAVREYDNVVFYRPEPPVEETLFSPEYGGVFGISPEGAGLKVDLDAFPKGCTVRNRREGDFIIPYGSHRKTLKKFLTERKISARLGKKLKVIASGSEILVVVGVEISDKVKVTKNTTRVGIFTI